MEAVPPRRPPPSDLSPPRRDPINGAPAAAVLARRCSIQRWEIAPETLPRPSCTTRLK